MQETTDLAHARHYATEAHALLTRVCEALESDRHREQFRAAQALERLTVALDALDNIHEA